MRSYGRMYEDKRGEDTNKHEKHKKNHQAGILAGFLFQSFKFSAY